VGDRDSPVDPLAGLPPPWSHDPLPALRAVAAQRSLVVTDDDPTGTQAVADVPVLTAWDAGELDPLLRAGEPIVYLLTNSRALAEDDAAALAHDVGERVVAAARAASRPVSLVSRSDSTLRGHFPAEVDALAAGAGLPDARVLLAPYLGEAGRVTAGDVHYLRQPGGWLPVADTEFARDPRFSYVERDLVSWARARTRGTRPVVSLDLALIRGGGPDAACDAIAGSPEGAVLVVNAVEDRDLAVVALGAAQAEAQGVSLLARSAASWVRIAAGRPPAPPVELGALPGPGLVVAGSFVGLTGAQLAALAAAPPLPLAWLELDVEALARRPASATDLAAKLASEASAAMAAGRTPVIATSRQHIPAPPELGTAISDALTAAVARLAQRPAWLVAKGGITSSEIATHGLGIRLARVLGPIIPGVPAWRAGAESRWPGLPFVVFPGNVGEAGSLRDVVARLASPG